MNLYLYDYEFLPNAKLIGKIIKENRNKLNLTANQLANFDGLNVDYKTIYKWESGMGIPDIQFIPVLANIFGISVEELVVPRGKCLANPVDTSCYYQFGCGFRLGLANIFGDYEIVGLEEYLNLIFRLDYLIQKHIFAILSKDEKAELEAILKYNLVLTKYGCSKINSTIDILNYIKGYAIYKFGKNYMNFTDSNTKNNILFEVYKMLSFDDIISDLLEGVVYASIVLFDEIKRPALSLNDIDRSIVLTVLLKYRQIGGIKLAKELIANGTKIFNFNDEFNDVSYFIYEHDKFVDLDVYFQHCYNEPDQIKKETSRFFIEVSQYCFNLINQIKELDFGELDSKTKTIDITQIKHTGNMSISENKEKLGN